MAGSELKASARTVAADPTLTADEGWHDIQVKWLVNREGMGADLTVVGTTTFPPGSKHDLHRHPNAEEWEYVISGHGLKHSDGRDIPVGPGDVVFSPRDAYHGMANTSDEPMVTVWGYCGVGMLDEAGYVTRDQDHPELADQTWPPGDA